MVVRIVDLKKAEMVSEDADFGDAEEFESLDFDQKLVYITEWMEAIIKEIINTAKLVGEYYDRITTQKEDVESLAKAFMGKVVQKAVVRDVLKGKASWKHELFMKEGDALKEFTKVIRHGLGIPEEMELEDVMKNVGDADKEQFIRNILRGKVRLHSDDFKKGRFMYV